MTNGWATGVTVDRRGFLRLAAGRHRAVTLACGRLFVRYVDAVGAGRINEFIQALEREIGPATEIQLVERQWLARDDFRQTVEQVIARYRATRDR